MSTQKSLLHINEHLKAASMYVKSLEMILPPENNLLKDVRYTCESLEVIRGHILLELARLSRINHPCDE